MVHVISSFEKKGLCIHSPRVLNDFQVPFYNVLLKHVLPIDISAKYKVQLIGQ